MTDTQRNFLILGCLAVLGVVFAGPFGLGAGAVSMLLRIAFFVVIIWALVALYKRKSGSIAMMPATPRLLLRLAAVVLIVVLVTGMLDFVPVFPLGWASYGGAYTLAFWAIILGCGFTIWWAWQQRTMRW